MQLQQLDISNDSLSSYILHWYTELEFPPRGLLPRTKGYPFSWSSSSHTHREREENNRGLAVHRVDIFHRTISYSERLQQRRRGEGRGFRVPWHVLETGFLSGRCARMEFRGTVLSIFVVPSKREWPFFFSFVRLSWVIVILLRCGNTGNSCQLTLFR